MSKPRSLFSVKYKVRYYDVDISRTVFFANYAKWLDSIAFAEYTEHINIDWKKMIIEDNIDMAIAHIRFNYKTPLVLDDLVEIHITSVELGNSSMTLSGTFFRGDTLVAEGTIVYSYVDYKLRRPIPVPEIVIDAVKKNLQA